MSEIHYRIDDVRLTTSEEVRIYTGEVIRAVWSVDVVLTAQGEGVTAGVILTDLENRLGMGTAMAEEYEDAS